MDVTNKTLSQLADMIAERLPALANEINDLSSKVPEARQAHEIAGKL